MGQYLPNYILGGILPNRLLYLDKKPQLQCSPSDGSPDALLWVDVLCLCRRTAATFFCAIIGCLSWGNKGLGKENGCGHLGFWNYLLDISGL